MRRKGTLRFHLPTTLVLLSAGVFITTIQSAEPPHPVWTQQITQAAGNGSAVRFDSNGDVIHLWSSPTNSTLSRFSSGSGALLWQTEIPADLSPIQIDPQGNPIVAGRVKVIVDGAEQSDVYTAKFEGSTGNLLWEKRYRENRKAQDLVALTLDGNDPIVMTSSVIHPITDPGTVLTKYSSADGTQLWQEELPGPGTALFTVGTNGTIAIAIGPSLTTLSSSTGEKLWSSTHSGLTNSFSCNDVIIDQSGNIAIIGADFPATHDYGRIYTAKFSSTNGSLIWEDWILPPKITSRATYGAELFELPDGDIIALGMLGPDDAGSPNTPYMVRYASDSGAKLWSSRYSFSDSPFVPQDSYPSLSKILADSADGNILFQVASAFYTTTSSRSATFKLNPATGDIVWQLVHTNLNLSSFDYQPDALVLSGVSPSDSSVIATLFRSGPELLIAPVSATEIEIAWSSEYLGWKLQRLNSETPSLSAGWSTVEGSEATNSVRLSTGQTGHQLYQLIR